MHMQKEPAKETVEQKVAKLLGIPQLSCLLFYSLSPLPPHRVLQWTTFIERTFCTENEPDRYIGREGGDKGKYL